MVVVLLIVPTMRSPGMGVKLQPEALFSGWQPQVA